jgi:competence protein ComEA
MLCADFELGTARVMSRISKPSPAGISPWWLRRNDQYVVAALALVSLTYLAVLWLWQGGHRGRLIDIDQNPRGTISFLVDINSADVTELMLLPEIGETLARRIVESRASHGPFRQLSDLRRVRGIGPKKLEAIRPYLAPLANEPSGATTPRHKV